MNDDFFTRFRKPPRQEFDSALYQRINIPMNKQPNISFRRAMAALAIGVALIAVFASSNTVRDCPRHADARNRWYYLYPAGGDNRGSNAGPGRAITPSTGGDGQLL